MLKKKQTKQNKTKSAPDKIITALENFEVSTVQKYAC